MRLCLCPLTSFHEPPNGRFLSIQRGIEIEHTALLGLAVLSQVSSWHSIELKLYVLRFPALCSPFECSLTAC